MNTYRKKQTQGIKNGFTISSGGFVNLRVKIFTSFLVTNFKTLVIYGKFVENLLTI